MADSGFADTIRAQILEFFPDDSPEACQAEQDSLAALAGLEAERDEASEARLDAEGYGFRLAAVLETTREALSHLNEATLALLSLAAATDPDLTRPEDASIVPAADQGGQNE